MKKTFILLMIMAVAANCTYAKDYAKLHMKEMKHAQKYSTTKKYFEAPETKSNSSSVISSKIKDPKIMVFGNQEKIDDAKYKAKLAADEEKYSSFAKSMGIDKSDYYNSKNKKADLYKLYRIAEKMIRANKLDFISWRIGLYEDSETPNAYSTGMNYVAVSSSLFDTFNNNDDALAMILGHEMAHALLGHQQRTAEICNTLNRFAKTAYITGNSVAAVSMVAQKKKFLIESKNMEYAADVEGAKLALQAGYNLDRASDVISFINTLPNPLSDALSDHPNPKKRLENYSDNRKYFIEEEWKNIGENNIYNSQVLPLKASSDNTSIVISASPEKLSQSNYYNPETPEEIYLRFAYKSYVNGEFDKAVKYFNDYFKVNKRNAIAYLYASYAQQQLYRQKGKDKDLEAAKEYINLALKLEPDNKYIQEQKDELN